MDEKGKTQSQPPCFSYCIWQTWGDIGLWSSLPRLWLSSWHNNNAVHFTSLLICHVVHKGKPINTRVCHPNCRKSAPVLIRWVEKWRLRTWENMTLKQHVISLILFVVETPLSGGSTLRFEQAIVISMESESSSWWATPIESNSSPFTVWNAFILEQSALTSPPPQGFCWMFWLNCLLAANDFKHTGFSSHYGNPLVGCWDLFCVPFVHALLTLRTLQASRLPVKSAPRAES